jgi:membrane protease YdiL (CAAX protease family)
MKALRTANQRPIATYLILTLIFSSIVWLLTLHATHAGRIAGRIFGYGIMWCPALATLITCRLTGRKISDLAWKWGESRYTLACYLIPLLYSLAAYLVIWISGAGGFYNKTFVSQVAHEFGWESLPAGLLIVIFFVVNGVIGLFGSMSTALGEEIGWRGFLVPELNKRMGYSGVSLTSGLIWAVWHYPLLVFGHYNNGTPAWYGLLCFTVMVVSISFVFTWYRLKSGSLWTGVMLHASHNLFIQTFFTPMTSDKANTAWFTDEFGAVTPTVTVLLAIYFWSRRKELAWPPGRGMH